MRNDSSAAYPAGARVDLGEAVGWYEDQRPGLGETFSEKVFQLVHQIAELPLRFPSVAPQVRRGLVLDFPYAVYFIPAEKTIVIIAVLHQRRDPEVWKRRV